MSVQEVIELQNTFQDWADHPRAWVLQANPTWGRMESTNIIALFDTKQQGEAYIEASKLPADIEAEDRKTPDGIVRTFRPDSLLWDYNEEAYNSQMIIPMLPWVAYPDVTPNPEHPIGPVPPVDGTKLGKPRYGKDFDVGYGGPKTNVDGATPEKGDATNPNQIAQKTGEVKT